MGPPEITRSADLWNCFEDRVAVPLRMQGPIGVLQSSRRVESGFHQWQFVSEHPAHASRLPAATQRSRVQSFAAFACAQGRITLMRTTRAAPEVRLVPPNLRAQSISHPLFETGETPHH